MNKILSNEPKLDFKDVLIVPKNSEINSRYLVNLERTFTFKYYPKELTCVPIIASNMSTVGTLSMAKEFSKYKCLTVLHKFIDFDSLEKEDINPEYVFLSCGVNSEDIELIENVLCKGKFDKICIDVANGYLSKLNETISYFRNKFPNILIMTGNVVTQERCNELIYSGADIVKIGIGSGSCCLTRQKTGIGYPQLSCILDCKDKFGSSNIIASDGGCSSPADICKAFGAGADFVMLGGMLGGHDECEGEIVDVNGKKKMLIYGMSSKTAQDNHNGGMKIYRASEGRSFFIEYRGKVEETLNDIFGGLRSYGTYIGCNDIQNFHYNTQFIKVNQQLNNPYDK
jgi:GMP reductase